MLNKKGVKMIIHKLNKTKLKSYCKRGIKDNIDHMYDNIENVNIIDMVEREDKLIARYTVDYRVDQNSYVSESKKLDFSIMNLLDNEIESVENLLSKKRHINSLLNSQEFEALENMVSKRDYGKYLTLKIGGKYDCVDEILGVELKIKDLESLRCLV